MLGEQKSGKSSNVTICVWGVGKCIICKQKTAMFIVYHECREKTLKSIIGKARQGND